MQLLCRRIAGNHNVGVVAEPLKAAIPNLSMNVIVSASGKPKKFNVPQGGEDEPNDHNASRKSIGCEKLTDRQEVGDACEGQRGHEIRTTSVGEVA